MAINNHSLEKTGTVAVEGGAIAYRLYEPHDEMAERRTPLVILHGGPGASHAGIYDSLNALADGRPAVFYDQLGSHFSPAKMTPELMRVERFADELGCLVKALSLEKPVILGHSWGGTVALEFVLNNPGKAGGLILSGPLIATRPWIGDCNALLRNLPQDAQDTIRRCEADGTTDSREYAEADKIFAKRHYCRRDDPPAFGKKHRKKMNFEVYRSMWGPSEFSCTGSLRDIDYFPRLHEIALPTLIVCGEHDTATPETMARAQGLIRGADLKVIPDAGHASYVDGNEAYLSAVNSFLTQKIDRRPSAAPRSSRPHP